MFVLLPLGLWYSERASYSGYDLPPEAPLRRAGGVFLQPQGRPKYWSIAVRTTAGTVLRLGCEPNESWWLRGTCLPQALFEKLGGKPVTITYFTVPGARVHERVLVGLMAADGTELVSATDRLAVLAAARNRERRMTWLGQLPQALTIAIIMGVVWEFLYGVVAMIAWLAHPRDDR